MNEETRANLLEDLPLLCCPRCGGELGLAGDELACSGCEQRFSIADGIPMLYWPNEWTEGRTDVTDEVKAFYEETPFPNYEEFDSVTSLIQKARLGRFAKLLDDQLPSGTRIIECGCGTGQLSIFLSIANRTVFGTDICKNSLRLGQEFKERNDLKNVHFFQMNLFRPAVKAETFDLVVSNGVLHHTSDPFLAFESISRLVRPNGYILIGLYHRYGRLITDARRVLLRVSKRFAFLDPNLRAADSRSARWKAWFMDQYKHPLESKHTIGEVMGWLERTGFRFVRSIPGTKALAQSSEAPRLFEPEAAGNAAERLAAELAMTLRGSREGGFFVVVGQKKSQNSV
jgi:SAM-dependent methyltransferase